MKKNLMLVDMIKNASDKIAPLWPLRDFIACNPLSGFTNVDFKTAINEAQKHFANQNIKSEIAELNLLTIKFCQQFFDDEQAVIKIPYKEQGFYQCWKQLAIYDFEIHQNNQQKILWLKNLPDNQEVAISFIMKELSLEIADYEKFFAIMFSSIAGWSGYLKYLQDWQKLPKNLNILNEFLAVRLALIKALEINCNDLIHKFDSFNQQQKNDDLVKEIEKNEEKYLQKILPEFVEKSLLINHNSSKKNKVDAQLVFCIDVRSEPFRRAIEQQGNYETIGFAGFFGLPIQIKKEEATHLSCPVLLDAAHEIDEADLYKNKKIKLNLKKKATKFYQNLKYNAATPFMLAEMIGWWFGIKMFFNTIFPAQIKKQKFKDNFKHVEISSIPQDQQNQYAHNVLKMIALTKNFAPLVVLCGHGSHVQNNSYASGLNCGACAGQSGEINAQILANILNAKKTREYLAQQSIIIPQSTIFAAAKHDTATDELGIYLPKNLDENLKNIAKKLQKDLLEAKKINNKWRASLMNYQGKSFEKLINKKSCNWSETRPEWGLARNASFVAAPRELSAKINLEGRSFLHSYDFRIDKDSQILESIMMGPMTVAHWINSQYLFSTIDNKNYGSGNKITQNIAGKIGVIQGNCSDLMRGLPLQSVSESDSKNYHELLRLTMIIYAPLILIDQVLLRQKSLRNIFENEWIKLVAIDPNLKKAIILQKDLKWKEI